MQSLQIERVISELRSMKAIGVEVRFDYENLSDQQKKMIEEYFEIGMPLSAIADQLCVDARL
ncbi:hypothetical protein [Pseudomonas syringae]|uniref:hypothetical protein n=2 Tax=Pseudomonas TaxID=286 RepID=UPI0002DECD1F|nr:hypothetical protein [Pseudomonas syringae]